MQITMWLEGTDVTKIFLAGLIVGIIFGQFLTLLLQGLCKKLSRSGRQ